MKKDNAGNLLQIFMDFNDKKILLSGLYGPNLDSPQFYEEQVFSAIDLFLPEYSIFVGDWNLVLDQIKDTQNYLRENNTLARNTVLQKIEAYDLNDTWRTDHEHETKFTWFKKDPVHGPKSARLDFFLISSSLSPYVTKSNIHHAILTDHSFVSLTIDFSHFQRGRGFFKFYNSLLKDVEFVDIVKNVIKGVTRQYATTPRDDEYWTNINTNELQLIELNINDQLFFYVLLMEIRGETIKYA